MVKKGILSNNRIYTLLLIIFLTFIGGFLLQKIFNFNLEGYEGEEQIPAKVVYFYMDGCSACKDFEETWNNFSNSYNGELTIEKIEREDAGNDVLDKHKVKGFPTVLLVDTNDNKIKEFTDTRTVDKLMDFANGK
jgi:thiol-disulfide isomerase/thioredoxin